LAFGGNYFGGALQARCYLKYSIKAKANGLNPRIILNTSNTAIKKNTLGGLFPMGSRGVSKSVVKIK